MGHPIHFMFRPRVGFSRPADRMALFPVRTVAMTWHDRRIRKEPSDVVFCRLLFLFCRWRSMRQYDTKCKHETFIHFCLDIAATAHCELF